MKNKNFYFLLVLSLVVVSAVLTVHTKRVYADKLVLKLTPIIKDNNEEKLEVTDSSNNLSGFVNEVKKANSNPSNNRLQGNINITEEKKQVPAWKKGQDEIKLVFDGLLNDLKDGKLDSYIPDFNKDALEQLASTYLFCSKMQGPCEFILSSLLEIETLRSIKNNDVSCSGLKQFWKIWIDNNYNKQLNYDLKLGLIERTKEFNQSKLPKYVQCDGSVKKNFKKDYVPNKAAIQNIQKTKKLVLLLGKKYGDISSQFMSE